MKKRLHYHLVDVFTDRAFGGNPLAVVTDGRGISEATMQAIAKEFNLSETTFVLPPEKPEHDFQVRIFTPAGELPMAGHPTIGTTFILARAGLVRPSDSRSSITLEEKVGPIPVTIDWRDGAPAFIEMQQPRPEFGREIGGIDEVGEMLSLEVETIRATNLPVQIVSCGVPYLYVPLDSLDAIRRIRFRADIWERVVGTQDAPDVFAFVVDGEVAGSQVHGRMFAPAHGIAEDAATGSAAGPLGCYLVRYGVLPSEEELGCVIEQGIEMGRPSFLHVRIAHQGGEITAVRVGGQCHYMGAGDLDLEIEDGD